MSCSLQNDEALKTSGAGKLPQLQGASAQAALLMATRQGTSGRGPRKRFETAFVSCRGKHALESPCVFLSIASHSL